MRVLMVSTYPPRECGIGSFTRDLRSELLTVPGVETVDVAAMVSADRRFDGPPEVVTTIPADDPGAYRAAAVFCDGGGYDVACVQHEFGIFGGPAGRHILEFADRVRTPVVTTAHTVLGDPPEDYRRALYDLAAASTRLIALTPAAVPLLARAHGIDPAAITVIHHGVGDVGFDDPEPHKAAVGLQGHLVLLTFGLLSRNKGVEVVLDALPKVVASAPELRYVVLGATHPEVRRSEGEAYRNSLEQHVARLDLGAHVEFRDRYVDFQELTDHLLACDVYVTPYQSREQITSGTLAYAVGTGRAVVSTPYRHAEDLLADGRGVLVPFGDVDALADALLRLVGDREERERLRRKAYAYGRQMTWPNVAKSTAALLAAVVAEHRRPASASTTRFRRADGPPLELASDPASCAELVNTDHLQCLTDDVGILQHATHGVPDRRFGYTSDDQARALLAAIAHHKVFGDTASGRLAGIYLSYLQFAQRPDGRLRNVFSYGRRWLDEEGTEDTIGQSLWALGVASQQAPTIGMRRLAGDLLAAALPAGANLRHVRSMAYALCGLAEVPDVTGVADAATGLAGRLTEAFRRARRPGWYWCDEALTYANTKVCEGLLRAGTAFDRPQWIRVGLDALAFVLHATRDGDRFDFVGNESWRTRAGVASVYAQQPIEAGYTAQTCAYAFDVTGDPSYQRMAAEAVAWLLGYNRLGVPLYDADTGACADGLERGGVSSNAGAESVICALLGLLAVAAGGRAEDAPVTAVS